MPARRQGTDRGALRCVAALLARRGGLVLIGGGVGIGKTALARALAREATDRGALVVAGHCYDRTDTPPYGLWRDLFAHWPRPAPESPPAGANGATGAANWPARLAVAPPFMTGSANGGGADHLAVFAQVRDYLTSAATGPLCLLLDDLHWADQASLDLLRYLARGLASTPILLVARVRALEPPGEAATPSAAAPTPVAVVPDDPAAPAEQPAAPMPGLMLTPMPPRDLLPPAGLTLREVEVLRLIAAGLSNREIAARLCLSVRTAERHIANIYKKIGAHSKADATAFAFNCGLL